jgi:hypothetical protein
MELYLKAFFFKIIAPMISLVFFAYAFSLAAIHLAKAWKSKKFKQIWLYLWIILVGLYFLLEIGK